VRIAGPIDNGWRVVNVAPSQEEFEVFAREQLIPGASSTGMINYATLNLLSGEARQMCVSPPCCS
jgi:hypothetical protein